MTTPQKMSFIDDGVPYVVEINMCMEKHCTNLRKKTTCPTE